ncbi:MAG: hypothetical protein R3F59_23770 [Myxococcota bacterium]
MDVLLELVFGLVFRLMWGGAALLFPSRAGRIHSAVNDAGLRWRDPKRARGFVAGLDVEGRAELDGEGQPTRLAVLLPEIAGLELTLRAETLRSQLAGAVGYGDLLIGEAAFDHGVHVTAADPAQARAVLDPTVREAVRAAVEAGGEFRGRRWQLLWTPGSSGDLGEKIAALAAAHHPMARAVRDELLPRLERAARADRSAAVRLLALEARLAQGPADPAFLRACEADVDVGVRLAAALALGDAGRDTVLQLVTAGSRTWRVRAALALGERVQGDPEALHAVEEALLGALADPELGGDAARGLARSGTPRILARLAAAEAGAADARAVREALAAIRAKVPPEVAGGLSIAEGFEQGALALAEGPVGGLREPEG